jgi:hypothetical protein
MHILVVFGIYGGKQLNLLGISFISMSYWEKEIGSMNHSVSNLDMAYIILRTILYLVRRTSQI